jgi:hypothetical protein
VIIRLTSHIWYYFVFSAVKFESNLACEKRGDINNG